MPRSYILECCVDSLASAENAEKGGADRLELCANLVIGGTTPSPALFGQIKERCRLPVHILIRPRAGDFLYTDDELEQMIQEVELFRKAGADGLVIGCLTPEGELAAEPVKRLIDAAGGRPVTLHRAFDMCRDPFRTLEEAKKAGVRTILTSGQAGSALSGSKLLKALGEAAGPVTIMAGAGITSENISFLLRETRLTAYHMSGKKVKKSGMKYRNPAAAMGLPGLDEYEGWETDPKEIALARQRLDGGGIRFAESDTGDL